MRSVVGKRFSPIRWLLLDGHRLAVTAALLAFVFGSLLLLGRVRTFEMQRLLTETPAVETLLNTLLRGIILLVSVVVSINSVVLSYDITSAGTQRERIEQSIAFRDDLGRLVDGDESPSDPTVFLTQMLEVIGRRGEALEETVEGTDEEYAREIRGFTEEIDRTAAGVAERIEESNTTAFSVLWLALDFEPGTWMNRLEHLRLSHAEAYPEGTEKRCDELAEALELFATGREYFKTLYYGHEFSRLSLTLLVVGLPAILIDASAILAINAGLLPGVRMLGLPPLMTFVAATFTVSLLPYVVLTSFTLRAATVARRTVAAGPFALSP